MWCYDVQYELTILIKNKGNYPQKVQSIYLCAQNVHAIWAEQNTNESVNAVKQQFVEKKFGIYEKKKTDKETSFLWSPSPMSIYETKTRQELFHLFVTKLDRKKCKVFFKIYKKITCYRVPTLFALNKNPEFSSIFDISPDFFKSSKTQFIEIFVPSNKLTKWAKPAWIKVYCIKMLLLSPIFCDESHLFLYFPTCFCQETTVFVLK